MTCMYERVDEMFVYLTQARYLAVALWFGLIVCVLCRSCCSKVLPTFAPVTELDLTTSIFINGSDSDLTSNCVPASCMHSRRPSPHPRE